MNIDDWVQWDFNVPFVVTAMDTWSFYGLFSMDTVNICLSVN